MADHNPFVPPKMPVVDHGLLLGFLCPGCTTLITPTLEPCGCYGCPRCGAHIASSRYASAGNMTAEIANDAIMGKARN